MGLLTKANRAVVFNALAFVAGRCDGAYKDDAQGFSAYDVEFGHWIVTTDLNEWTPKMEFSAYKMATKYRGQHGSDELAAMKAPKDPGKDGGFLKRTCKVIGGGKVVLKMERGLSGKFKEIASGWRRFDWDEKTWTAEVTEGLPEWLRENDFRITGKLPKARKKQGPTITVKDEIAVISFEYDPGLVHSVKQFPGRKFDGDTKEWTVPLTAMTARGLADFAEAHGFKVKGNLIDAAKRLEQTHKDNVEASRAEDADIVVPGLGGTLFPFQKAGVVYALSRKRTFLADQMGLGKTVEALATIQAAGAFPTLVVCPASLKLNWERETLKWLPGKTVQILSGSKPNGEKVRGEDVTIINYDILQGWVSALTKWGFKAFVADESHKVKNGKTLRSKAAANILKTCDPEFILFLTGTPFLNRPSEGINQLKLMGRLAEFGGFWEYANRYCKAYNSGYGLDLSGSDNLEELNDRLRASCFIRRLKEQVLTELPSKRRVSLPMEITNRREYQDAENNLAAYLGREALEAEDWKVELSGMPEDQRKEANRKRRKDKEFQVRQAEHLVRFTALKQLAAKGKMKAAKAWIGDFLESGEKLVVFAHHQVVVNQIAAEFNAPSITGATSLPNRQAAVDRFQTDPKCNLIVLNMEAGGIGLTLTAASDVLFLELGWTPALHDQAEDRCHRIGQEGSVTAWYILAEGTIEDEIYSLLEDKREVVNAATEGEAIEANVSVTRGLIERLLNR